jgi:ligand-binding sensor domain-containing protein
LTRTKIYNLTGYRALPVIFIFTIINWANLLAQDFPELQYRSITTKDGLSSNGVSSILQSSDKRIWISTGQGLNMYDGNRIQKIYTKDPFYNLKSNFIVAAQIDNEDNLFLSCRDFTQSLSLKTGIATKFYEVKDVYKIEKHNGKINIFSIENFYTSNGEKLLKKDKYLQYKKTVIPIRSANISIGHRGQFAVIYKDSLIITSSKLVVDTIYKINASNCYFSTNDDLYINTWDKGIYKINGLSKKLVSIAPIKQNVPVNFAEWNYNNKQYIVIPSYLGIYLYDVVSERISPLIPIDGYISNVYIDADNNLWLGTTNGVKIISALNQNLQTIRISAEKNGGEIYQFNEIGDYYWVSKRYGKGFCQYNRKWQLIKNYQIVNHQAHNSQIYLDAFFFMGYNGMVYATGDYGMFKINPKNGEVRQICHGDQEIKLRTIVQLNNDKWLIRSNNKGVFTFYPKSEKLTIVNFRDPTPKDVEYSFLIKTGSGKVLLTTTKGIFQYLPTDNKFVPFDPEFIPIKSYYGIVEDEDGLLWLGTNDGVECYNLKEQKFISLISDNIDFGVVLRIYSDFEDNIWLAAESGYYKYIRKDKRIRRFDFDESLLENSEQPNILINSENKVFLAGSNYLYQVNSSIFSTPITNFLVFDIYAKDLAVNNLTLTNTNSNIISLPAGTSHADLYVSFPSFEINDAYKYFYKIGQEWIQMNKGYLNLTNLKPGTLDINIKAEHKLSLKSTPIQTLRLYVLPYWYQTTLLKLFLFILVLTGIYLVYNWRKKVVFERFSLQSSYDLKMLNLEMQNLRTQMNPHFIFNSLNSINSFIVENKTHLASDYLTKFSKLIRLILELSKSDLIPLSKELELLKLYLMIESLRFNNSFQFNITTNNEDDLENLNIPPMILQPYVENAIWHGLLPKEGNRNLSINISVHDEIVQIVIEDNGIGRKRAKELRSKSSFGKKSFGMEITEMRLKQLDERNSVKIIDLTDHNEKAIGTRVEIQIYVIF